MSTSTRICRPTRSAAASTTWRTSSVFPPALMEGYLRAASQISRLAVGDRNASATSVTYKIGRTGSQMRQVDGAPVGTRGGISVVHVFPADGEYVDQGVDAQRAARRDLRPLFDADHGHRRAARSVDQRRTDGTARRAPEHERDRSTERAERPRARDAANPYQGRAAASDCRVHSKAGRSCRRPDRAARKHARRREHQLRRDRTAAHAGHDCARTVEGDGRVRDRQPPQSVHLPPDDGERRGDLCRLDYQAAHRTGVSRRDAGRRPAGRAAVLCTGAHARRLRNRHPHGAAVDSRQPALPFPARAGSGSPEGLRALFASATRISRRASRSFCGGPFRMPSS